MDRYKTTADIIRRLHELDVIQKQLTEERSTLLFRKLPLQIRREEAEQKEEKKKVSFHMDKRSRLIKTDFAAATGPVSKFTCH